jgi:hypothetical protein
MALLGGVGRRPRRAAFAHGEVHACYYHDLQGRDKVPCRRPSPASHSRPHTREDKAKGSLEKERRMDIRALKMLAIGDITVRA